MKEEFWQQRWQMNEIGFHQQETNVQLLKHWDKLELPVGSTVFAPMCGKSLDMLWLLGQGYRVIGVEISPIAVEALFEENKLEAGVDDLDGVERWHCGELVVYCGNFFRMQSDWLQGVDAVYDRAALVALPEEMRRQYMQHMKTLLPSPLPTLLITLDYLQSECGGPPFAVSDAEVRKLYANQDVDCLFDEDVLEENPGFQAKGITALKERVYLIR